MGDKTKIQWTDAKQAHGFPPSGHPLQKLGARLAELLDEDQFAECARLLLDGWDAAKIRSAPRWLDVADELPQAAQEVLFVRDNKTVHGAWIGGIFWHNNQKMAAAKWMPLPLPPTAQESGS